MEKSIQWSNQDKREIAGALEGLTEPSAEMNEKEEWCLEAIWVMLETIETNRGKIIFKDCGDFYDNLCKCRKIINKALNERRRKK